MYADRDMIVRVSAHFVEPLDEAGQAISRHNREFGSERTDTVDWTTMLDQLMTKPGAWKNSVMRSQMAYEVRDYMDEQDKSGLKQALKLIKDLSTAYGLDVAMTSMHEAIVRKRTEGLPVNATMVAARIAHYGLDTPGEPGPDMSRYDELLHASGGMMYGPQ